MDQHAAHQNAQQSVEGAVHTTPAHELYAPMMPSSLGPPSSPVSSDWEGTAMESYQLDGAVPISPPTSPAQTNITTSTVTTPPSTTENTWMDERDPFIDLPRSIFTSLEEYVEDYRENRYLAGVQVGIGYGIATYKKALLDELAASGTIFGIQLDIPSNRHVHELARRYVEQVSPEYFDPLQAYLAAEDFRSGNPGPDYSTPRRGPTRAESMAQTWDDDAVLYNMDWETYVRRRLPSYYTGDRVAEPSAEVPGGSAGSSCRR